MESAPSLSSLNMLQHDIKVKSLSNISRTIISSEAKSCSWLNRFELRISSAQSSSQITSQIFRFQSRATPSLRKPKSSTKKRASFTAEFAKPFTQFPHSSRIRHQIPYLFYRFITSMYIQ
uniref:Uncharacterized protein n=1 Tax=Lotus japonicus TaxID=34305 RepID=I3SWN3_LOTJA|nr:unknown [Lotus japonicus]